MSHRVILDTGPLVAYLIDTDQYHRWAREHWQAITPPMHTCESVLSETAFLLFRRFGHCKPVFGLLDREVIRVTFSFQEQARSIADLMKSYANVPMSLADACLVRMSELHQDSRVFTLDGDFRRYRRLGRRVIPLTIPPDMR